MFFHFWEPQYILHIAVWDIPASDCHTFSSYAQAWIHKSQNRNKQKTKNVPHLGLERPFTKKKIWWKHVFVYKTNQHTVLCVASN